MSAVDLSVIAKGKRPVNGRSKAKGKKRKSEEDSDCEEEVATKIIKCRDDGDKKRFEERCADKYQTRHCYFHP